MTGEHGNGTRTVSPTARVAESTARDLSRCLDHAQRTGRSPSVMAAVVQEGQIVWAHGRGRIEGAATTLDTQYRIGSITKTITSLALMRLRDRGVLGLTDPVGSHVPDLPPWLAAAPLSDLLRHTAAVAAEPAGPWWERSPGQTWDTLRARISPADSRPALAGRFHYSNLGYALLGQVLENRCAAPWFEVVQAEVLVPLRMSRTTDRPVGPHALGWSAHPWADLVTREPALDYAAMAPAGGLWSTARDLARLTTLLGARDSSLLASRSLREMRAAAVVSSPDSLGEAYGYGIELRTTSDGALLVGNFGSLPGFRGALWNCPARDVGAVVLANATSGTDPSAVAQDLIRIVPTRDHPVGEEWLPTETLPADLTRLAGTWYWGARPWLLRVLDSDRLTLAELGSPHTAGHFVRNGPEDWLGLNGYHEGEPLRVRLEPASGDVYLDLHSFVLTRAPYEPATPIPGGFEPSSWHHDPGPEHEENRS